MKPNGRFWREVAVLAVVAAACFASFLAAHSAHAAEPPHAQELLPDLDHIQMRWRVCHPPDCALYSVSDVVNLGLLYDAARNRVLDLERQLAELKKAKGCAKLEVTEPPRNFTPKKEHDS